MEQTIENFNGTKVVNATEGDVQATLEFVEHIYNYLPELGFATLYALAVYTAVLWIRKKLIEKDD